MNALDMDLILPRLGVLRAALLFLWPSLLIPTLATSQPAFIIVNPGGPGNQSQAQGFLADFEKALHDSWPRDFGQPPAFRGHYHVTVADALASIRGQAPAFALVTTEFFLAQEQSLGLQALLAAVPKDDSSGEIHLVVRDGSTAEASLRSREASGLRLAGQGLRAGPWLERVLLAGLQGSQDIGSLLQQRTLKSVRDLRRDKLDAVLMSDAEWLRLESLGKRGGLAVAHSSPPLPRGPLVSLTEDEPDEQSDQRAALARQAAAAVRLFPETEAGRKVLERMGLKAYGPVAPGAHDHVRELFTGAPDSHAEASP